MFGVTLSCGLLGAPWLFWVPPCEKQERGGCVEALGGRESGATGSLSRCVGALHCVFLFPQGGLGLFVQLMPILILIIVSALSQMMVSSPPYSLSHRLLVPIL